MKKQEIVKKTQEFQNIIRNKKQFVSNELILYYMKNDSFQIGISIPKKFVNAVGRNYLRRQIRAIVSNIDYQSIKYKVILIIRKDYMKLTYIEKEKAIKKFIERLAKR
ncbi:MAG: ribonuclease P protein component [Metamycoplasmataceae bacterium]